MAKFILSGFADEIADDLSIQTKVLNETGVKYVEMRGVNGKSLIDYSLDDVRNIKKELDDAGIRLSAIGSYLGKQAINAPFTHLEKLQYTLEVADIMDVKSIRMFSFFVDQNLIDDYRDEVMDRWGRFTDCVKGTDFLLLHENEKGIYGESAERCLDLITTIGGPNMSLIFDPANFIQSGVETYPHAWNLLKEHVTYMHIKDSVTATGQVVPSGYGDGKILEILTDLNKRDESIFLSLEPHLADFNGFASLSDEITKLPSGDGATKFVLAKESLDKILYKI